MKKSIQEVVVVEGKTDTNKLLNLYNVRTIETNGSDLKPETIAFIKKASEKDGVILFLDPDGPGEKIRKILQNELVNFKQCFIEKKDMKNTQKIGVAEATDSAIIAALESIVTFNKNNQSIKWDEYFLMDLNNKKIRNHVCNKLQISYCNHKQLFKRLNMMNITPINLMKILKDYGNV